MRNVSPLATTTTFLMKPREAAEALGISEKTLWSRTAPRGPIPVVRLGRSVRYSVDALRRWIDEHQQFNGKEQG